MQSAPHPENQRQRSVNNFQVLSSHDSGSDWLQTSIYRILAAFTGKHYSNMLACRILRMSVNGASTIYGFASWVIYVLIGCRHPSIKYLQPLLAKTTATCSLAHPENERQWSVTSFSWGIFGNQGIALIFVFITELLTTLIGQKSIYQR